MGDAISASRSAHGRWLADSPGRTMTGGRFGGAALRPDANVAVAEGGRADAVGPSRQARTHGPGVSCLRAPARWITGPRMAAQRPEASSAVSDALRNSPQEHSFSDLDSERARPPGPLRVAVRPDGGTPPKEMRR